MSSSTAQMGSGLVSLQTSRTDQCTCAAGSEPEQVQACVCACILRTFEACSSVLLGSPIAGRLTPSGQPCVAAWTNLQCSQL